MTTTTTYTPIVADVVRLNSGGPDMNVHTVSAGPDGLPLVHCTWDDGNAASVFPAASVQLVYRAPPHPDMGGVKFSGFAIKHEPAPAAGINFDSDEPIPEGKACSIVDPTCESCQ